MPNGALTELYKCYYINAGRNRNIKKPFHKNNFNNIRFSFKKSCFKFINDEPKRWKEIIL